MGLLAAVAVAVLGALLAPAPWTEGPAQLLVRWHGDVVATAEVDVGSTEHVQVEMQVPDATIVVTLPRGVPVDEPVVAYVRTARDGVTRRPSLDSVSLTLTFADAPPEALPLLAWDDAAEHLVATRHPPDGAAAVLALLGAAVVLWVTSAIPLFATALAIPVALAVTGAMSANDALAPFFHPIIALFLGGFLMAEAMRRAHLDRWAAHRIVAAAGRGPATLMAGMMATAAFLSMWMSNTAAVAVLIPIALAVAASVNDERYTKGLVLGCAYAATIGGVGSAIGTPANLLAIEFLGAFDLRDITFAGWFAYGLPTVVLVLPIVGVAMWRRYAAKVDPATLAQVAADARAHVHESTLGRAGVRVLVVFAIVAAAWLTQGWHGVHPGIVALAGAVSLAVLGDVEPGDLARIEWSALLTFGAGLSLGLALTDAGVADWVASRLSGLASLPDPLAVATVGAITLALTTVASNTASAATLIPLAIPLAALLGVAPTQLVLVVAVASSIDFALIIGTPPTMLAYSTGLFTPAEILRAGAWLDLAALAVLVTLVTAFWQAVGLT